MNLKSTILIVSICHALTILSSSQEYEHETSLIKSWQTQPQRSTPQISDAHAISPYQIVPIHHFGLADSIWRPTIGLHNLPHSAQPPSYGQSVMANAGIYAAHQEMSTLHKALTHSHAFQFIQQHRPAQDIHTRISANLETISKLVYSGNVHDREVARSQLNELRSAYNGLCHEFSQSRLDRENNDYDNFVQGKNAAISPYNTIDGFSHENIRRNLLILERNTIAVHHLKKELNNLIDGLEQSLYKKGGGFIAKLNNEFATLLTDYKKQYAPDCRSMIEFSTHAQKRFKKIETHRSNKAIEAIKHHLEAGNLKAAEQIVNDYNKTFSQRKYKEPVREALHASPQLNEFGIPRICVETNPQWSTYKAELLAHPEHKLAIARQMHAEHTHAQNLCRNAGIDHASLTQIQQAHQLMQYQNDPRFSEFTRKALQGTNSFSNYCQLFEKRLSAMHTIQESIIKYPESGHVLRHQYADLLHYATDPDFASIINTIAEDSSCVEDMKHLLATRSSEVINIERELKLKEYEPAAVQIAYDLTVAESIEDKVDILSSLTLDSEHEQTHNTYHDPISKLPRILPYDEHLLEHARELQLPPTLSTQAFIADRTLYTHVMLKQPTSPQQREQAQQYLNLLKQACSRGEHQEAYRALTHLVGQTYLNPAMQTSDLTQQQNIALCNEIKKCIADGDIATAANTMTILQQDIQNVGNNVVQASEIAQAFIQKNAFITVAEKTSTSSSQATSSSHVPYQQSEIDFTQLRDQTQAQHAAVFGKTGTRSEYLLSRENSLSLMAQGDHSIQTKNYTLNAQAQNRLKRAGINTRQFTECTGNLIQQDTHTKLINTINMIADTHPTNAHTKLIKDGTFDCAQVGTQLNHKGNIQEAMSIADLCQAACNISRGIYDGACTGTSVWWYRDTKVEPTISSMVPSTDSAATQAAAQASAELTYSLLETTEIITRSIKGFTIGSYEGVKQIAPLEVMQNLASIVEHIASETMAFIQNGAYIEDCLARGDPQGAEQYYLANNALLSSTGQTLQQAADTLLVMVDNAIAHAPHTPAEWERASQAVGEFTSKNIAEAYLTGQFFRGASKLAQGISDNVRNLEQIAHEVALSAQFSGNPATTSMAGTLRPISYIENALSQNGSRFVNGISATHPEFASHVIIDAEKRLLEGVTQVFAEGTSTLASQTAKILQLGKQIGSSLTEAKPGHIDFSRSEQSTTETNSSTSSSSASSSNQYVAATEEAASRTGKLSKAEKTAQAELRAKERVYLNEFHEKEKIKCESHHIRTTKGRHELTDMQEELRDLIPGDLENEILAKPFDYTMQTHVHPNLPESINAAPKPITFNYEHISPEFEIHCSKGIISSKGFHHDYLGKIEKSGFISVIEKEMLPNNCYKYSWSSQGTELKSSTFFPKNWTRAQAIEKICESMMPVNTRLVEYIGKGKYTHFGLTAEGIPVTSVIKVNEISARIISAYPDFITYKKLLNGGI